MREIKFRAWDGKRMLTGECLYWNGISFVSGVWNFEEEYIPTENQVAVEVMQFTGLTDINVVEIYESDIAQCDRGLLWVIKFINGCFMACNPVDENDYCMIDDYPLAVVGNEFQNPELLEQS